MIKNSEIFFPPEWFEQDCVQLTWPHKDTDFADVYDDAIQCFSAIAYEIAKRQKLLVVCRSKNEFLEQVPSINLQNCIVCELPLNDVWARDHGGITVFKNEEPVILDFCFNGWGNKFNADFDTKITTGLFANNIFSATHEDLSKIVLEGGGIETNGKGVMLTTESCMLHPERNPHLSKANIIEMLKEAFGQHTVLCLQNGHLEGDDTDGHIDTLARFLSEDTIVYVECTDKNDSHFESLQKMKNELQSFTQENGKPYNLIPLPMVPAMYYEGERLPATYANFLIMNSAVLVPIYNKNTDAEVLQIFKNIFKDKEIVAIDCSVLVIQHGSLHCVTMQYPKTVLKM